MPVTEKPRDACTVTIPPFPSQMTLFPGLTNDTQKYTVRISEIHGLWNTLLLYLPSCVAACLTPNTFAENLFSYPVWQFRWWARRLREDGKEFPGGWILPTSIHPIPLHTPSSWTVRAQPPSDVRRTKRMTEWLKKQSSHSSCFYNYNPHTTFRAEQLTDYLSGTW